MLLVPAAYETLMKVFLIKFSEKEIEENWKVAIYLRLSRAEDLLNPIEKDFNFQCDSSTSSELNEGNYSLLCRIRFSSSMKLNRIEANQKKNYHEKNWVSASQLPSERSKLENVFLLTCSLN